mgnify:CR=1 FL=1
MNSDTIIDYFKALERLKLGKSLHLPKGTKITNDAVSLEAQRGKGSIKKSRPEFAELICAIAEAAETQARPSKDKLHEKTKLKSQLLDLRNQLDAALAREMSLVYELVETKRRLAELTNDKVIPIGRH